LIGSTNKHMPKALEPKVNKLFLNWSVIIPSFATMCLIGLINAGVVKHLWQILVIMCLLIVQLPLHNRIRNEKLFYGITIIFSLSLIISIGTIARWDWSIWILITFILSGYKRDVKEPWKSFYWKGIILLITVYTFYLMRDIIWSRLEHMETQDHHWMFYWNDLFTSIPFNNGIFLHFYHAEWFVKLNQWAYGHGYYLCVLMAVIRSFFIRDSRKMIQYCISGHFLQGIFILPFYFTFRVEEVWYVLGDPDGMDRHLSAQQAAFTALNCFPSMHTSIAFAVILLALREKGRVSKFLMIIYSSLVIFSTLYLEIHWVLDVIAGMVFAYFIVKLSDVIMHFLFSKKSIFVMKLKHKILPLFN
jgi:membrane-associated phospholipid phosphatase